MKPEEINKKIAEACGWTVLEPEVHPAIVYHWGLKPNGYTKDVIPDYYNSLDAMHEAEGKVRWDECEQERYEEILLDVIVRRGGYHCAYQLIHASASARAEAFLRFFGLWEE